MNFCGSNFENCVLENCDLSQTNLSGTILKNSDIFKSKFEEYPTLRGHNETLTALSVSPNGSIIASENYEYIIVLWDAQTGK